MSGVACPKGGTRFDASHAKLESGEPDLRQHDVECTSTDVDAQGFLELF